MRIWFTAAALVSLTACSGGQSVADANKVVDGFHARYNAGQIDGIYASTGDQFKSVTNAAAMKQFMTGIRDNMGGFRSSKQVGWRVNAGTAGSTTVVVHDSKFAKGNATETFTLAGDPARIIGYNINPTSAPTP